MNKIIIISAGVYVLSLIILIVNYFVAPEGYQDKNGFHYGKEK